VGRCQALDLGLRYLATSTNSAFIHPGGSAPIVHPDHNHLMASATDGSSEFGRTLDPRVLVDNIPALAWSSHSDGSFDFLNQRWCDYTGLSPEESYGQGWKTAIHPADLATLVEKWDALTDANVWQASEVRLRRSDGMFRWFSIIKSS
jgi:PAS domain S-box-containing protein